MEKCHDFFCERSVTIFYVTVIDPEMSCCVLNFKHFHYENGLIVITLLENTAICTERGGGEREKEGDEREKREQWWLEMKQGFQTSME